MDVEAQDDGIMAKIFVRCYIAFMPQDVVLICNSKTMVPNQSRLAHG